MDQVAVAQDRLQGRDPGVGAQHEDAIVARLIGQLAGVDLEGLLGGGAEIAPVGGVADQRLVAPLQLLVEGVDDGAAVGGVLAGLGLVAAHDVAPALGLDFLDEELGLRAPGPLDTERREGPGIREHHGAHQAVRALAGAEDVFQPTLLESGDGWGRDHAAIGHHTDPTDGEAAAQAINDRNEHADIGGVAGPHLRADRPALRIDHHAHDHLHEVGAVVLGVAPLAQASPRPRR